MEKEKNINISKTIGNNIKELRKIQGITQKEIASKLFMTQQQYSRFETGIFEFNYEQLLNICLLLDTTPNEIFDFE